MLKCATDENYSSQTYMWYVKNFILCIIILHIYLITTQI